MVFFDWIDALQILIMTRNGKQMAREITATCKFSLALLFVLCSAPVTAELNLSEPRIDIHDYSSSEKVFVYHDGKSVLPGEITKIVAGVFKTGRTVPEHAAGGNFRLINWKINVK